MGHWFSGVPSRNSPVIRGNAKGPGGATPLGAFPHPTAFNQCALSRRTRLASWLLRPYQKTNGSPARHTPTEGPTFTVRLQSALVGCCLLASSPAVAAALSADDTEALGRIVYAEAGTQPIAGKAAVLAVVLNRAGVDGNVQAVIDAPGQFEPVLRAPGRTWRGLPPLSAAQRTEFRAILDWRSAAGCRIRPTAPGFSRTRKSSPSAPRRHGAAIPGRLRRQAEDGDDRHARVLRRERHASRHSRQRCRRDGFSRRRGKRSRRERNFPRCADALTLPFGFRLGVPRPRPSLLRPRPRLSTGKKSMKTKERTAHLVPAAGRSEAGGSHDRSGSKAEQGASAHSSADRRTAARISA